MKYSVVMPAHRTGPFLIAAIRSVERAIEGDDAELILVVNGEDRQRIISSLKDAGVAHGTRVIECEIPALIYALNRGVEVARGEFIARMDSDDICLPERFRRQYELARQTEADFIFSGADMIDAKGHLQDGRVLRPHLALWRDCGPIHPAVFMRRTKLLELGGYGNLEHSEDYHLWLRASLSGSKLVLDQQSAIMYRVHQQQATDRSAVVNTFATNVGVKVMLGLRFCRPSLLAGACLDLLLVLYRRCADKFF